MRLKFLGQLILKEKKNSQKVTSHSSCKWQRYVVPKSLKLSYKCASNVQFLDAQTNCSHQIPFSLNFCGNQYTPIKFCCSSCPAMSAHIHSTFKTYPNLSVTKYGRKIVNKSSENKKERFITSLYSPRFTI